MYTENYQKLDYNVSSNVIIERYHGFIESYAKIFLNLELKVNGEEIQPKFKELFNLLRKTNQLNAFVKDTAKLIKDAKEEITIKSVNRPLRHVNCDSIVPIKFLGNSNFLIVANNDRMLDRLDAYWLQYWFELMKKNGVKINDNYFSEP